MLNIKRLIQTFCAMVLFSAVTPLAIQAQDKPDSAKLAGVWKMSSLTPDGETVGWRLVIKLTDGKWAASLSGDKGELPIKNLTVTGSKMHFTTPYEGQEYDQDLKLDGEKLIGTWSGNGDSGKTTGERATGS
jgi:hypothetical protein